MSTIVSLPLPITLLNGTVADAGQVMTDLNAIASNVNSNAAKNGVNSDITSLTALISIAPGLTITGATISTSTISASSIIGSTIDATTTGVTQTTGTSNTTLATTQFVTNTAFSTVLPGQGGNAGKFLTTNGSSASWAFIGINNINSLITTSTTLTGTYLYVPVQMASSSKSVTLPSALTLTNGGPLFAIDNSKGAYAAGIRDNTGALLTSLAPGGVALLTLQSNATQAGVWSIVGNNLEPGLITIDSTLSSTFASTILAPYVAMDSNTSIHFAALSSGFAAFIVDNAGKVLSAAVTVSAAASSVPKTVFKISATTAIVFYGASATDHQAVVLTVSGSSPSLTLSVGTPQALTGTFNSSWDGENFVGAPKIAQLSTTLYLASFTGSTSGTGTSVAAISVSGTAITIGAVADILTAGANSTAPTSTSTSTLTSNTGIVFFGNAGAPSYSAVVITVVGTTCGIGVIATTTVNSISTSPKSFCQITSTKYICLGDNNTSTTMQAFVATISGTTVSFGTRLTVESGMVTLSDPALYTVSSATRYNPHLFPLTATTALLWYLDGNGISRAVILTESSGTLTAGTIIFRSFCAAASGSTNFGAIGYQNATDFISIVQNGVSSSWKNIIVPHKINGTTITYGDSQQAPEFSSNSLATAIPNVRLSQGDYLFMGANSLAIPVYRSNGDVINKRGAIAIPNLSSPTSYPIPAPSSNRVVLLCGTQGTTAAIATQQLRVLNLEIAQ